MDGLANDGQTACFSAIISRGWYPISWYSDDDDDDGGGTGDADGVELSETCTC